MQNTASFQADLEANKALVRSHYEELTNRNNMSVLDEQVTADFVDHEAPPDLPTGPEGIRQWMRVVHAAFPDIQVTLEDIMAEGDKVAVRAVWRGTHSGTFMGIAATGRRFILKGMVFWRLRDGRIAERWGTLDLLGLMQQLGALSSRL